MGSQKFVDIDLGIREPTFLEPWKLAIRRDERILSRLRTLYMRKHGNSLFWTPC